MSAPDCARFLAWLDAGRPGATAGAAGAGEAAAARAHASTCATCARELAADDALEALLHAGRAAAPAAPAGFSARVLAAIGREPRPAAAWVGASDPLPWWARIVTERTTILASIVAGAFVAFAPTLAQAGREMPAWLDALLGGVALQLEAWLGPQAHRIVFGSLSPAWEAGVTVGALLLAYPLYRLGIAIAGRVGGFGAAAPRRLPGMIPAQRS